MSDSCWTEAVSWSALKTAAHCDTVVFLKPTLLLQFLWDPQKSKPSQLDWLSNWIRVKPKPHEFPKIKNQCFYSHGSASIRGTRNRRQAKGVPTAHFCPHMVLLPAGTNFGSGWRLSRFVQEKRGEKNFILPESVVVARERRGRAVSRQLESSADTLFCLLLTQSGWTQAENWFKKHKTGQEAPEHRGVP